MLQRVRSIFAPPFFPEDEDKTRKARYANVIAFAFMGIALAYEAAVRVFGYGGGISILEIIVLGVAAICFVGLILMRHGYVQLASMLLVFLTWAASNGLAADGYGARDASYIVNFAIVLMAGLLIGAQGALIVTILSICSGFALAYAEQNGLIGVIDYPAMSFARDTAFVFGLSWVILVLLINGLERALKRSRTNLVQLESANTSLNETQRELQNRSAELIMANQQLENRTKKLHAIAIVTRTAAAIQDFELLLASVPSTISRQLDYYHVGLFLLDEHQEFAILRSANTEAGQRLLSQGYRVPVAQSGPMELVIRTGRPQARVIRGEETIHFHKLDLTETRSQLLLPLKSGEQVIGILDFQATEENAFSEDDISILSILADQVAINIQNLLLYEQSQSALRRADTTSLQASAQSWKAYEKAIQTKGYRYDGIKSEPLKELKPANNENGSFPIQLRGQTIGSFRLNPSDPSRGWTDDELVMVKATAERVALALEGARLLEEAQKRATREAFLSDVATKLSASFQLDSILRDTVQELGQTLKNSTVTFQLINPSAPPTASESEKSNGHTPE